MKKIAGHINEDDFARLIGSRVNSNAMSPKKDVLDAEGRTCFLKSGKKWLGGTDGKTSNDKGARQPGEDRWAQK